jgi:hypothetical protein
MFERSCLPAGALLAALGASGCAEVPVLHPGAIPGGTGAVFGHVQVVGPDGEVTKSCIVEFMNQGFERVALVKLDETGWIFTSLPTGPTYLSWVSCPAAFRVGGMHATRELSFDVEGGKALTYFGHVWVGVTSRAMDAGDFAPGLAGQLGGPSGAPGLVGASAATIMDGAAARPGLLSGSNAKDLFPEAVREYQRRYGADAAVLTPQADVAHKPIAYALGSAPASLAGFELGQPVRQAEAVCKRASLSWAKLPDDGYACGGAPVPVFAPARVRLTACGDKVCALAVDGSADGAAWKALLTRYVILTKQLEQAHGDKHERDSDPLPDCTDGLKSCFAAGRARTSATWRWPQRRVVSVALDGGPPGGAPSLVLTYAAGAPAAGKP